MPHRAPRQYELDWLRLLAVVFVAGVHLAQTYASAGADPIADSATQPALARVLALTAYLRMPVLFCLAGMVAVHTRGHRPLGAYLRTRAERLLPPLLLGLAVLWPVQQALEGRLTGEPGQLFGWGYFWFLGALAAITVVTIPVGVWLRRPAVQARLARAAPKGRTLVVLAGLPLLGTLLPYRWVGDAPVLAQVDVKALVGYGGDFVAGMVLASAPAFRTTVMHRRGAALLVWALAAATQVVAGPRLGGDGHVSAVAEGVASWSWVLACYGFAARYLAAPSPVLARWGPRALALYVFHGVALAAARCVALPLDLPLALELALLVTLAAGGTLALVRLAESFRATATGLGLRYAPAIVARRVSASPARPPAALDFQHLAPLKSSELEPEAGQPVLVEAPAPVPDGLHGEPEGAGDLRVALAGGRAQDDPRGAPDCRAMGASGRPR